jgi:hypothetical protein
MIGVPELLIIAVLALVFAHWLWMVVEAAKEPSLGPRVLWLLVVLKTRPPR